MRAIIRRHNRVNGLWFSLLEFALIALCIGTFASYYVVHQRVLLALVGIGITLNCIPVMVDAAAALRAQRSPGAAGTIWNKAARPQIQRENPHMLRDTLILSMATLIPFVAFIAALFPTRPNAALPSEMEESSDKGSFPPHS